jgi:hypothetical protein
MAARALIVIAMLFAMVGCSKRAVVYNERKPDVVVVKESGGPPPHAPAHGYRHKHNRDAVVLTYDSGIAVYVVSGYKNCWYNDGVYFRLSGSTWEMSARISGPWKVAVVDRDVPVKLKSKYTVAKSKPAKKGKSKKAK